MKTKLYGKSVWEYLNDKFDTPLLAKTTIYEVGTVLHTAHPRQWTNATIVGIEDNKYVVLTDIGNYLYCTTTEMQSMYLPPVCRRVASTEKVDWNNLYTP